MNPTPVTWTAPADSPLPDFESMAHVADVGALLCERVTIAGLELVDGLVLLSSRQVEVLSGERSFDSFWREESDLFQSWGSRIIDCARECGDALLAPAVEVAKAETPGSPAATPSSRPVSARAATPARTRVTAAAAPPSKAARAGSTDSAPMIVSAQAAPKASRKTVAAVPTIPKSSRKTAAAVPTLPTASGKTVAAVPTLPTASRSRKRPPA